MAEWDTILCFHMLKSEHTREEAFELIKNKILNSTDNKKLVCTHYPTLTEHDEDLLMKMRDEKYAEKFTVHFE